MVKFAFSQSLGLFRQFVIWLAFFTFSTLSSLLPLSNCRVFLIHFAFYTPQLVRKKARFLCRILRKEKKTFEFISIGGEIMMGVAKKYQASPDLVSGHQFRLLLFDIPTIFALLLLLPKRGGPPKFGNTTILCSRGASNHFIINVREMPLNFTFLNLKRMHFPKFFCSLADW